jgi:ABC-type transport system involved in multi-copper enzyme maturation permease subunit
MFILMWTAWQSLIGWQDVRDVGTIAHFGGVLFLIFVMVQLTLMLFFAPLAAATAVAHEKDRRTFVLLLMTDLRDIEIVLGKLLASLLQIGAISATALPVFFLCLLLGGVSASQVADIFAVTAAAGLAGGSLGLVVALWRDRTFQSLALTVLVVALVLAGVEAVGYALPSVQILGVPLATALNPYRTVAAAIHADANQQGILGTASLLFVGLALATSLALVSLAVVKLRVWNPGKNEPREQREGEEEEVVLETIFEVDEAPVLASAVAATAAVGAGATSGASGVVSESVHRELGSSLPERNGEGEMTTGLHVPRRTHRRVTRAAEPYRVPWQNPIVWREMKTRGYGTKPLLIKAAYLLAFALAVAFFYANPDTESDPWRATKTLIPIAILSLILVNAQGVTALTSERDTGALDLLLVTELTPSQFIYGKLYGILYNTKEMVALPVLLTIWFAATGVISTESAIYVIIDFLLLAHFAAMLGLHAGITYTNSRTAVANSLGTIFFLMVGILICAFLIMLSNTQFGRQLLSFLIFIGAGSVALFGSLGAKNPSQAIALASLLTPFWTFYCIISLLHQDVLAAFLVSAGIYGFALAAMLVPAVSDFDIALGRTNAIQG